MKPIFFALSAALVASSSIVLADDTTSPPAAPPSGIRSPGMVGGGIAALVPGIAGVIVGNVILADVAANQASPPCVEGAATLCELGESLHRGNLGLERNLGAAVLIGGGVLSALGTSLIILGVQPRERSPVPTVGVGLGAATARWTF